MKSGSNGKFGRLRSLAGRAGLAVILFAGCLAGPGPDGVHAQQLPSGITPEQLLQLQQLQQLQLQSPRSPAVPDLPTQIEVRPDATLPPAPLPVSRLEQIISQRAGAQLRLFGYNVMGSPRAITVAQSGAVQDDYILGPGDEIVVSLRGQEERDTRIIVNRDGQVVLPRLSPILATGRSFGAFREDMAAAVRRAYVATEAFVSLGRVRQISVLVSGEVTNPGQRIVPGLASAVDAILLSGGIRKTGSLRSVQISRGGRIFTIDLYSVLSGRSSGSANLRLADGDRIIVPTLGPVVAISGLVRRPAIYELPAGQKSITADALVSLAGEEEVRGVYRLSLLRVGADGRTNFENLQDRNSMVRDSEILFVQPVADQTINRAILSGGTGLAGSFPVTEATRLSTWLRAPGALGVNPYTLFGIVSRRDPRTLMRILTAITPVAVLAGKEDLALQTDDIVRVITVDELRVLVTTVHDYERQRDAQLEAIRNPVVAANVNAYGSPALSANGAAANGGTAVPGATNSAGAFVPGGNISPGSGVTASGATIPAGAAGIPGSAAANATGASAGSQALGSALLAAADSASDTATANQNSIQSLAGRTVPNRAVNPAQGLAPNFEEQAVMPGVYASNRAVNTFDQIAQQLNVDTLVLTNFLLDHEVTFTGAVRGPGTYFVGPSVILQDLITAAGGMVSWTDTSSVEVISTLVEPVTGKALTRVNRLPLDGALLANYVVKSRDQFRFNEVFNDADIGSVTIQGEIRFAGAYKLARGERLSDLLARAGGLTNAAYPYGTVFLRKSVAAQEQESYMRAAMEVENQLVIAMTRVGNAKIDPTTFTAMQGFVNDLRMQKALGRISVRADPSLLAARPALDPALEAGDVIYIPPRPSTVAVLGQVMQSGSFPYEPGLSITDYIERAGGYARYADESETFVVLPDGSARRIERSWLKFDGQSALPPGSAIVVPRDITPLDLRQTIIDVTQIVSQLAVSLASVAVISK